MQFLYEYFRRHGTVEFNEAVFEALWRDLFAEIDEPYWIFRGVANMRCFRAADDPINLGDGITIRGRNPDDLANLGFDDYVWDRISEDWGGFGSSSFVMVVEHRVPKQPDNLMLTDLSSVSIKAMRALGALRLAGVGSVSIGPMWVIRPGRFNVGLGGHSSTGVSIPTMGSEYVWTEQIAQRFPAIYSELRQLEPEGYSQAPGNLAVALRAFMATYDRWPSHPESQLLDAITALEAVLGTEAELSFRLAFRVSGLLAATDDERARLLKLMKGFYDTRSRVVHGGALKQKHTQHLGMIEDLRSLVRRLLRSFLAFGASPPNGYNKSFFDENLDAALVHAAERQKLRTALRLD